jgi:hypothetical protein
MQLRNLKWGHRPRPPVSDIGACFDRAPAWHRSRIEIYVTGGRGDEVGGHEQVHRGLLAGPTERLSGGDHRDDQLVWSQGPVTGERIGPKARRWRPWPTDSSMAGYL